MDVNVGLGVADGLSDGGHDAVFAGDLDWCMPDVGMLPLGRCEERVILTMDTDLCELVYHSRQPHVGVFLLRMPGANREEKLEVVREIVDRYGDQLPDRFSVYQKGRLRNRR